MKLFIYIFIRCTLLFLKCLSLKTCFHRIRKSYTINQIWSKSHTQADDSFIKWAQDSNITCDHIGIKYTNQLRGLFSEKDFNPSDVLLKVPLQKCFFGGRNLDNLDLEWPVKIAIELIQESEYADSRFQSYFDMLPHKESLQLPQNLNILQDLSQSLFETTHRICPDLLPMIESQIEWRRNALGNVKFDGAEGTDGKTDNLAAVTNYQKLSYFLDIVQTRNCRLTNDNGDSMNVVVPFLDLLNHRHPSDCNAEFYLSREGSTSADEDYAVVACKTPIKKGDEICITYGAMEAHEALVSYGFIPSSSPFDECKLLLPLLFTDPLTAQLVGTPLSLLTRLSIFPDDPGYAIYRDGVGMALLVTARVLSLSADEANTLMNELNNNGNTNNDDNDNNNDVNEKTTIFNKTVSLSNELKALELIQTRVNNEIHNLESVSLTDMSNSLKDDNSDEMQLLQQHLTSLRAWKLSIMNDTANWLRAYHNSLSLSVAS